MLLSAAVPQLAERLTARDFEMVRKAAWALAAIPEKFREILVLREVQGLSYEEIAETLHCSKGTVESRLFRARARLREKLKGYCSP